MLANLIDIKQTVRYCKKVYLQRLEMNSKFQFDSI